MPCILFNRYYCRKWLDKTPNRVPPHNDNEICMEKNKCLRSYFRKSKDRLEATIEFVKFPSGEEELGQFDSLQDRWNLSPEGWWVMWIFTPKTSKHSVEAPFTTLFFLLL